MKNHYLRVITGSVLLIILAGSFNFKNEKSLNIVTSQKRELVKNEDVLRKDIASTTPEIKKHQEVLFFKSKNGLGQIGVSEDKPIDNPIDNIFHVKINKELKGNETIWLEYELKGVSDYTGISCSINDQLAIGGYLVKKSDNWITQKERINPKDIKQGDNVIRFTISENSEYNYEIRNLGIRVEPYSEMLTESNRKLIVNQPTTEYYYGKLGYLQGFVVGDNNDEARVYVNGEKIRYAKGNFESIVEKPYNSEDNWAVRVQAIFPDGHELYVDVPFNKPAEWDYKNDYDKDIHYAEQIISKSDSFKLQLADAKLIGNAGVLENDTRLSITALRDIDVPALDAGMVNVTSGFKGYRFLPHGTHFNNNIFLELGYDTTLIPQGYTAQDIKTYFFDESTHHWVALPKDSLLLADNSVRSITNHFTDMINGIIKVPESPETQEYVPTSLKDIKAANPATGINLIEPPTANSTGSANLTYPINIPAGRQGMQPNLTIQYKSNGGNGWLGLDWNLPVPSIAVDIRWGVPYFDEQKESETYLMNGKQLSPVAHRAEWATREPEKIFYPRVEGSFSKIVRHGNNPDNYWWEVTDRKGIRYFYGGHSDSGMIADATLRDDFGNISKWLLVEIRDLDENFIHYNYSTVVDAGIEGGTVLGRNVYLENISYTGHESEEGKYNIIFTRDRELNEPKRKDVSINARYGFKEVTADLLRSIKVKYNGEDVRSYELEYSEGAFSKTLLSKITEYDSEGNEFNNHLFSYYDNSSNPYSNLEVWNTQEDDLNAGLDMGDEGYQDQASAIGSNKNNITGYNEITSFTFLLSSSGNGYNSKDNESEGLVKLVDVNGDGLPDKLFKKGGDLFYRPQIKTSDGNSFGSIFEINGDIKNFLVEKGSTDEFVFEFDSGLPFGPGTGVNVSGLKSKTHTYMIDVNADGLIDIVDNGKVYYNHCDEDGNIQFLLTSEGTQNPIPEEGEILESVQQAMLEKLKDLISFNPHYDAVKYWLAPYDGLISINAPANVNPYGRRGSDGVYLAIQHNEVELWRDSIEGDNFNIIEPTGVQNLEINKGDRIYFRVQSKTNDINDNVSWNPEITYIEKDQQLVDPNNKHAYKFNSADDFLLNANSDIKLPYKGKIAVKSLFTKPVLSDDIELIVLKNDEEFVRNNYSWDQIFNDSLNWLIDIDRNDTLKFLISSETNVRWEDINWHPQVYYDSVDEDSVEVSKDQIIEVVPKLSVYSNTLRFAEKYNSYYNDTIRILPYINKFNGNYNINFTIKSNNQLIYKDLLEIKDSLLVDTIELVVTNPTKLYFEFFTPNLELAKLIDSSGVILRDSVSVKDISAGLYSSIEEDNAMYGCLYRNWGQFVYDGSDEREMTPINENYLTPLTEEQIEARNQAIIDWFLEYQDDGEIPTNFNFDQEVFIVMIPNANLKAYKGVKSSSTIGKDVFTSSRLRAEKQNDDEETGVRAVTKINNSLSEFKHSSEDLWGIGNVDKSKSRGFNKVFSDFMDVNGDRYPDIVTDKIVQYTNQRGDLSIKFSETNDEYVHFSKFESEGKSAGTGASGSSSSMEKQSSSDENKSSFSVGVSFGITGGGGTGSSNQSFSLYDINGDGLPDKVNDTGLVHLNLGYRFAEPELWNFNDIRVESNTSVNAALSGGISGSYSAFGVGISGGTGISRSDNFVTRQFSDINNDGLIDIILLSSDIKVMFNTGNGFTEPRNWFNRNQIESSATVSEYKNIGGSFSAGWGYWKITTSYLDINIDGVHRQEALIRDVDGDGFPDYLKSNKDNELKVNRSNLSKTNLLKEVHRPLNSTITLDYESVGNTFDMPHARQVLSSVTVNDGHSGDGADKMLAKIEYSNGKYDRYEREFYGFGTVRIKQMEDEDYVYRTVVKDFDNSSYYKKGLLLNETIEDNNGKKYVRTENTYELKDFETKEDVYFPVLTQTNKYFYSLEDQSQSQINTLISFEYGDYGNIIAYKDFGNLNIATDNTSSTIEYWKNLTDKNVLSVPKSITVKGSDGQTYRKRETSIDNNGKITQIRQYLKSGQPVVYDMFYDKYGNLDSIIRPENYNGERMYFAYDYDNVVHSFVTNVRDAYGYSSSTTYDYRFGQILSTKDINGQQTLYELDDVGRIAKITGPYELESGQDYTIRFAYYPNDDIAWAHTQHYDPEHPQNPIETAIFIDGLGRVLQTKKDGAIFSSPNANDEEVMLVSGKVVYDALGRSIESYYPVTESKGSIGAYNYTINDVAPTKVSYDILDRVVLTELPDGAKTETSYGFGNDREDDLQFKTNVTDAEEKVTVSYTNVKGLQTAIKAPGDIWTSFIYNSINELTDVTDAEDNITVSEYDMLGRRISRDHPDAGLTEYTYDLAGNLLTMVTTNLREENMEITYEYDHTRLTNINYPQNPENNVIFQYGESGSDYNRAGRVVVQEDATGAQEFFYGPLGEITKNVRTIIVPDDGIFTFVTEWQYDTWNRLKSMVYPDGEELTYEYNTGGLLRSMFGKKNGHRYDYLKQLGYDKFEDRIYLAYGNGTETTYDYEPERRRLHNITATTSAGRQMMNNTYGYDDVNNILSLKNNAPIPTDGLKGGPFEYDFHYDDLYRLDHAEGTWHGVSHEHRYSLDMKYSATGSIERKTQTHDRRDYLDGSEWIKRNKTTYDLEYQYEGEKPHAPSKIGVNNYTYDANGNQIRWEDEGPNQYRDILWDEENRIRAIADNGNVNHYIYDASGERVIKSNGDGQVVNINGYPMGGKGTTGNYTMYVNPFMVVNSMKFTKHFYIEGERIVSKLGDMGKNQDLLNPKDSIRAGNNGNNPINWDNKQEHLKDFLIDNFNQLGLTGAVFTAGKSGKIPYGQIKKYYRYSNGIIDGYGSDSILTRNYDGNKAELLQFYYHPDHLGSSSYITDVSGEVYQHMEYFPFGETFVEERTGTEYTTYLFNGKEFDEEIGLYYFGARYYDPKTSIWQSVDPMLDKHPDYTPYAFVYNNPVKLIDPFGLDSLYFNLKGKVVKSIECEDDVNLLVLTNSKKIEEIEEAILAGDVVNVPKDDVVEKMEEAFDNTEDSGKENGFRVGNNGTISIMVEGSGSEINSEEWKPAIFDLRDKGDLVSYDVHTHPLVKDKNGNVTGYGVAQPSGTDVTNVVGNQPNVVLGYRHQITQPNSNTIGGTPTVSFVRQIGFFNSGGQVGTSIDFSRYKSVVKKINKR